MKTPKTRKERNEVYKILSYNLNRENRFICNCLSSLGYSKNLLVYKELWFICKEGYDGYIISWDDLHTFNYIRSTKEMCKRKQILLDLAQLI